MAEAVKDYSQREFLASYRPVKQTNAGVKRANSGDTFQGKVFALPARKTEGLMPKSKIGDFDIKSTARPLKEIRAPHWQPYDCEACNHPFDPKTWQADWSLSGELTWSCPKCGHPNFPSLG